MKVGDKVKYVPDKIHSRERDRDGNFPWIIGKKTKTVVVAMTHNEYALLLKGISRMPEENRKRTTENLVHVKPAKLWDATVRTVTDLPNGKQLACLDITSGTNPGVTLHYDNVVVDNTGLVPNTCCDPAELKAPETPVVVPVVDEDDDSDDEDDK